jgi:hypothetical protein
MADRDSRLTGGRSAVNNVRSSVSLIPQEYGRAESPRTALVRTVTEGACEELAQSQAHIAGGADRPTGRGLQVTAASPPPWRGVSLQYVPPIYGWLAAEPDIRRCARQLPAVRSDACRLLSPCGAKRVDLLQQALRHAQLRVCAAQLNVRTLRARGRGRQQARGSGRSGGCAQKAAHRGAMPTQEAHFACRPTIPSPARRACQRWSRAIRQAWARARTHAARARARAPHIPRLTPSSCESSRARSASES